MLQTVHTVKIKKSIQGCFKNSLLLFNAILLFWVFFNGENCLAQGVAINTLGNVADASSILDVNATNQGILIPRLSSVQRNLLPFPATGLLIYNTSTNLFNYYNGNEWYKIGVTFVSSSTGTVHPGGGVSVNVTNTSPDSSAILDVNDPSRGILVPRPTGVITTPAKGLIIYNTSTNRFNYYNGIGWIAPCATSTEVSGATGGQNSIGAAINTSSSLVDASAIGGTFTANYIYDCTISLCSLGVHSWANTAVETANCGAIGGYVATVAAVV